jgi:hypothetical protein
MLESSSDLITVALGLMVVWWLWVSIASGESRQRRGRHPGSERSSSRDSAGARLRR